MRTMKAVIATVALGAVGIATSMADPVYSANVVGFINVTLQGGKYYMLGNQLNGTNNLLSTVIPVAPNNTTIFKWLPASSSWSDAITYYDGAGWYKAGDLSTDTLAPGEGVFISSEVDTTLTFVGEVPTGALSTPLSANLNVVASVVPQSGLVSTDLAYSAVNNDTIFKWNAAAQTYEDSYTYYDGAGWYKAGDPVEPTFAVGEAFWLLKDTAGSWTRTFNVQ